VNIFQGYNFIVLSLMTLVSAG